MESKVYAMTLALDWKSPYIETKEKRGKMTVGTERFLGLLASFRVTLV